MHMYPGLQGDQSDGLVFKFFDYSTQAIIWLPTMGYKP